MTKADLLTAVLQDLGGSDKLKISFVLGNISEKIKNWEGFPQTLQSHKTLAVSLVEPLKKDYQFQSNTLRF